MDIQHTEVWLNQNQMVNLERVHWTCCDNCQFNETTGQATNSEH